MIDTKLIAQSKIDRALRKIEAAHMLLSEACGELYPLVGMYDEWNHIGDLYDKVRAGWYFVGDGRFKNQVDLDPDEKRRLEGKKVHVPHPIGNPCEECDAINAGRRG